MVKLGIAIALGLIIFFIGMKSGQISYKAAYEDDLKSLTKRIDSVSSVNRGLVKTLFDRKDSVNTIIIDAHETIKDTTISYIYLSPDSVQSYWADRLNRFRFTVTDSTRL